ncbi:potassium/sodium hyperpolarization-activated cyclic nucleotide-gated channel 2-like isoform X1 [Electrophorus electricus]|uniref:potassium/sodium hyperpolarization-activated cyclic nucleotide-gated channel 2-like isoform X1 n=1 Tax=Electrophorus electricus TaxID=8005 RepID=UPI0015CFBC5C|nr:potassium/sodium hyperpolarization-activated cyclic nucleotide-gated channel 2-like isoform X1 [Electrophorus electricus]
MFLPSVNRATLSYFRSVEAVKRERIRASEQKTWIIHPYCRFRNYWLIAMLLITLVNMVVIPLSVSFFAEDVYYSPAWIAFTVVNDFLFVTDLCLNFRIGLASKDSEVIILDPKKIKNQYLKTWFFLDLLAVAPVDYCLLIAMEFGAIGASRQGLAGIRMTRLIKLIRLFSLLRLLRISKLLQYVRQWEEVNGWNVGGIATFFKFMNMIAIIILLCHWNACIQFMVVVAMDFPKHSWVILEGLVNKPMSYLYSKSMFRALCQMMTLNYGSKEIPKELTELCVVVISIMVGSVIYTMIFGRIFALVSNSRMGELMYDTKCNEIKEFMRQSRLPTSLRNKIMGHLENRYWGKWFDEKDILKDLSEPLRQETVRFNCSSLNMSFFKDAEPLFITGLLELLEFEVYEKGDLIIRKGALGDCMYFIERGTVEVRAPAFSQTLTDGAYFGELCLMTNKRKRMADVMALTLCRLYSLSVDSYNAVLSHFPEMKAHLQTVSQERRDKVSDSAKSTHETEAESKPPKLRRIVYRVSKVQPQP